MNMKKGIMFSVLIVFTAIICYAVEPESPVIQSQQELVPLEEKPTETKVEEQVQAADVPIQEDTTPKLAVERVNIVGNSLISTEELFEDMPDVYSVSKRPVADAVDGAAYDLRTLKDIIY